MFMIAIRHLNTTSHVSSSVYLQSNCDCKGHDVDQIKYQYDNGLRNQSYGLIHAFSRILCVYVNYAYIYSPEGRRIDRSYVSRQTLRTDNIQ